MENYTKPLPKVSSVSRAFWEGTKRGELLIQQCEHCKRTIFYPRLFCPTCLSQELVWTRSSGRARIETFSIIYHPPIKSFENEIPYIFAIVRLEEGAQMASNIIDCSPEVVHVGMEVEVTFVPVTEEFTLPKFKPIE